MQAHVLVSIVAVVLIWIFGARVTYAYWGKEDLSKNWGAVVFWPAFWLTYLVILVIYKLALAVRFFFVRVFFPVADWVGRGLKKFEDRFLN